MTSSNEYTSQAKALLFEIGLHQLAEGVLAFTDMHTASHAYIHHSRAPTALVGYAVVNPIFASGRFPGYTLTDLVDKAPNMDGAEYTALAIACGASAPVYPSTKDRAEVFGKTVWEVVTDYGLEGCFERVLPYGNVGDHYTLRPRGIDTSKGWELIPDDLKAMRKSYRAMSPLNQIMVLTIMHLYCQGKDKTFLIGGCPTKILAADAIAILRSNGNSLATWGRLVSHYAGW